MKTRLPILACLLLLSSSGCARFSTKQTDISYEQGKPSRSITTRAASYTFFSSKSDLAKWKASQTDKTQGAEVGGLSQTASGTNVVNALGHLKGILEAIKP